MVRPHSMDLREHAMQRLATGETTYQVAAALNVAVSSVIKWAQKHKKSGSVEPGKMGGHKPFSIDGEHKIFILSHITKTPGTSLGELVQLLDKRGLKVHPSSVSRFLLREGINLKADANLKKDQQVTKKSMDLKPVELKLVQKIELEPVAALKAVAKSSVKVPQKIEVQVNQLELVQPEQKTQDKAQRKAYEKIQAAPEVKVKSQPVRNLSKDDKADKSTNVDIEHLLDVPQQNGIIPQIGLPQIGLPQIGLPQIDLPQINFVQMDMSLPTKPVLASLEMFQTALKCRREFYQTCFNSWTDICFSAFKR